MIGLGFWKDVSVVFLTSVFSVRYVSRWMTFGLLVSLAVLGCAKHEPPTASEEGLTVELTHPHLQTIVRNVGQPSFVESYERTSIYPKVTGYIEKWNVDIGDQVKKNDVLATLFVPELVEDRETKHRTVELDQERVDLALKIVDVARADVDAAKARLEEAKETVKKYDSDVLRWSSEVKRLKREVEKGVVDPQILLESQNQLRMSTAARDAAKATVLKAKALLASAMETLAKDLIEVKVARRNLAVAKSDARRLDAWVGYLNIVAPYSGVITARNANTWDFVTPATGDPTADPRAPYLSPSRQAAPIYVVDRTDIVRVFVDIPEEDANYVRIGTKATVLIRAYSDQPIRAAVTRTSWALNVKSRTLRAEIDLPNTDKKILPGMYAYGTVTIERRNVRALPLSTLAYNGNQAYYWAYEDGHAVRTEVDTGVSDEQWIEVIHRKSPSSHKEAAWIPINGTEKVIVGDLSNLSEGEPVQVVSPEEKTKIARIEP